MFHHWPRSAYLPDPVPMTASTWLRQVWNAATLERDTLTARRFSEADRTPDRWATYGAPEEHDPLRTTP